MVDGKLLIEKLLVYAKSNLHLEKRDEIYFRNLLLREFKLDEPMEEVCDLTEISKLDVPDILVKEVEDYALENNIIVEGKENLYSTYIFGLLSPLPSKVNQEFKYLRKNFGEKKACEYLYNLSVKNNYVQKTAIGRNLKWEYFDEDKYLEITINLSKPEKDNKEIAKLLTMPKKARKYPACLLCKENEGFEGTLTHPARENIRTISVELGGEPWFIQYSPYAYYNEHLIAISESHTPMHIKSDTIDKVLDFVDFLPNYMIGSNAALPIIGGSILNHEHFQGGEHLMPMHNAKILTPLMSTDYSDVKVGIVDWYNSVLRLESENRDQISSLAKQVILAWENYSNESCYIYAKTDGVRHNSLSPVARKQGSKYILDMIFRNNITNEQYPDGVFHAHPEYHNIKKEGIGLIEAMGLFILPGRLKKQLHMIAEILCKETAYIKEEISKEDNYLFAHRFMIEQLVGEGYSDTMEDAEKRVTNYVNNVCKNILLNTAVFKKDEIGVNGFLDFLTTCGIKKKVKSSIIDNQKYDIILLAGQSNASGTGLGETDDVFVPQDNVKIFRNNYEFTWEMTPYGKVYDIDFDEDYTISTATERYDGTSGNYVGVFALYFAREYAKKCLKDGRKLLIVDTSIGGTGFKGKHWGIGDKLYNRMMEMTDTALNMNKENRIVSILWHQGEHDAYENRDMESEQLYSDYKGHLADFINSVREKYGKDLPFICAGFSQGFIEEYKKPCETVLQAIQDICKSMQNIKFISTKDLDWNSKILGGNDTPHFTRKSCGVLGKRYFEKYLEIINKK